MKKECAQKYIDIDFLEAPYTTAATATTTTTTTSSSSSSSSNSILVY